MNQAIANIIKGHIEGLHFVDKIAGLTSVTYFDVTDKDKNTVQKAFPVACCVTADDCKVGAYNELMPDSKYKTVIYFEDRGVSFTRSESNWKYYTSNLRLVCWINVTKLIGVDCKEGTACTVAAHLITDIIRALPSFPEHNYPFNHVYSEVVNQEVRSNGIFAAYTYDEKHSQYLMYPYDYFALDIQTNFAICMESTQVYDATCCESTGWFLPSKDELNLLQLSGVGPVKQYYWSSSENNATTAWAQNMADGTQSAEQKGYAYKSRAIRTFEAVEGAYAVGDEAPCGGTIFYVDTNTFYEVAPTDTLVGSPVTSQWSNITNVLVSGTLTTTGSGAANTALIIAQAGHIDGAAKLCSDLVI